MGAQVATRGSWTTATTRAEVWKSLNAAWSCDWLCGSGVRIGGYLALLRAGDLDDPIDRPADGALLAQRGIGGNCRSQHVLRPRTIIRGDLQLEIGRARAGEAERSRHDDLAMAG
jgi:hypothetical protein